MSNDFDSLKRDSDNSKKHHNYKVSEVLEVIKFLKV